MSDKKYELTEEMKEIREEIYQHELYINKLESQIFGIKKDIDSKWKKYYSLCTEHVWENERENYMYGERYQVCKLCGMCR